MAETKLNREDLLPPKNSDYATKGYWEERYSKDTGVYDWFRQYEQYKDLLRKYIFENNKILHVGCGNSVLGEDIYDDFGGKIDLVNMDYAANVIDTMKARNKEPRPNMKWEVMDLFNLPPQNDVYDVVLDKGTMDAIMCEQGDVWEVPDELQTQVDRIFSEITRVLKPGGRYIYITFGQPHFRKPLLLRKVSEDSDRLKYNWSLKVEQVGDGFFYYVYICTKDS